MKIFSFVCFLFTISCIFWITEICFEILDKQCHIEKSLSERAILAVKAAFGVAPPDPDWWRPLCKFTSSSLRDSITVLCNVVVISACIVFFQRRRHKKKINVTEYPDRYDKCFAKCPSPRTLRKREKIKEKEYCEIARPKPLGLARRPHKRVGSNGGDSITIKKIKRNSTPFYRRPRKIPGLRERKQWYDGYLFIPHVPTTEQTVYRAVLLGPVNDCFKYLISLLTSTFGKHGVAANAIKWAHSTDQVGTMVYITGQSEWIKVEADLTNDGINICIHRVVKVQGLLRFVDSRAYQLTYMGLTCVGQDSNTMYGAGWNL